VRDPCHQGHRLLAARDRDRLAAGTRSPWSASTSSPTAWTKTDSASPCPGPGRGLPLHRQPTTRPTSPRFDADRPARASDAGRPLPGGGEREGGALRRVPREPPAPRRRHRGAQAALLARRRWRSTPLEQGSGTSLKVLELLAPRGCRCSARHHGLRGLEDMEHGLRGGGAGGVRGGLRGRSSPGRPPSARTSRRRGLDRRDALLLEPHRRGGAR